jgi:hypothetical protein
MTDSEIEQIKVELLREYRSTQAPQSFVTDYEMRQLS